MCLNRSGVPPSGSGTSPTPAIPSRRWPPSRRSEEHTSELQSLTNLVCRLLLEKKKKKHVKAWRWNDAQTTPVVAARDLRKITQCTQRYVHETVLVQLLERVGDLDYLYTLIALL